MTDDTQTHKPLPDSESFRTVRNSAEEFGTSPKGSESFRTLREVAERKENHTLTVREVARMFEVAGVARTERSIVNWCQPNRMGIARLDCYFDPNERKYFITLQSVELAIAEEKAKAEKLAPPEERNGKLPNAAEAGAKSSPASAAEETVEFKSLKQEIMDLKITNRGKDYFIEQLKNEREAFGAERQGYVEKLMTFNQKVGELETRLLQIESPRASKS